MKNIHDWLEDNLFERGLIGAAAQEASEFDMLAGVLRAQAELEGYRADDLEQICGGDISAYLLAHARPPMMQTPTGAYLQ